MGEALKVYISATTADLGAVRSATRHALLARGYVPVEQEHLGLVPRIILEMLRRRIEESDAVLHIVGECHGAEPPCADDLPRRSYTQWEYDLARELEKPLYVFVCRDAFPYLPHAGEPSEARELQRDHRAAVLASHEYQLIDDLAALDSGIRDIQLAPHDRGEALRPARRGLLVTGAVAALLCLFASLYFRHKHDTHQSVQVQDTPLEQLRAVVEQVVDHTGRVSLPGEYLTPEDRLERAINEAAAHEKISPKQVRADLKDFAGCVRRGATTGFLDQALADFAEKNYAGSESSALRVAPDAGTDSGTAQALLLAGDAQMAQLKPISAEQSYRAASFLTDKADVGRWVDTRWRLGAVLDRLGRYPEALALWLEISTRIGKTQQDAERALQWQATELRNLGRWKDSASLFSFFLPLDEERTAENLDVAANLHELAFILKEQGQLAKAERFARRALATRVKLLGAEHPEVALSLSNLASILLRLGELAEAEPFARRALAMSEKLRGAEHPDVAATLDNLASLLKAQSKPAEAEPLARRALAIREKLLGAEHPNVAASLQSLARLLHGRGKLSEAEPLYRRSLAIYDRLLARETSYANPLLTTRLNDLAGFLLDEDRPAEAEPFIRRALAMQQRVMEGERQPEAGRARRNLGMMFHAERRELAAEVELLVAVDELKKAVGDEHPDTVDAMECLGKVRKAMGKRGG